MRAVIDGIIYDTDAAEPILGWRGRLDPNYDGIFAEFLYVTSDGRWFVAGERRGDLSRVVNAEGSGGIRPVPGDEAQIAAAMVRNHAALMHSRGIQPGPPKRMVLASDGWFKFLPEPIHP